jgi:predicted amidophosphoribosyltransferase
MESSGICYYCRANFEPQFEHDGVCDKCLDKIEAFFQDLGNCANQTPPDSAPLPTQLSYLPVPDDDEDEPVKDNSRPPAFVTVEKDEPVP